MKKEMSYFLRFEQEKVLPPMLLEGPDKFITWNKSTWSENTVLFGRSRNITGITSYSPLYLFKNVNSLNNRVDDDDGVDDDDDDDDDFTKSLKMSLIPVGGGSGLGLKRSLSSNLVLCLRSNKLRPRVKCGTIKIPPCSQALGLKPLTDNGDVTT